MTEKTLRKVYRPCPCFAHDIEGIQTWLEELAREGLFLEPDGRLLSVFAFYRAAPRQVKYRLQVGEQAGFCWGQEPSDEMREFSQEMGWEYLEKFGNFHIYRSMDPDSRELNTDPAVQETTLRALKKAQRSSAVWTVLYGFFLFFLSSYGPHLWRLAAIAEPWLPLSILGIFLWSFFSSLLPMLRLQKYQKRLRARESLTARTDWQKHAHLAKGLRLVPWMLFLVMLWSLGTALLRTSDKISLEDYREPVPFVTLEELFPEAELDRVHIGDFNNCVVYETLLADNYEWRECAYAQTEAGQYYGILTVDYHETASAWYAERIAEDYYRYEARRFRGKRFEDLEAAPSGFDSLRIFRSYGILHIVAREGTAVFHATVQLEDPQDTPVWELWLAAMEEKLCR